jgi:glycosyltransferase involved in cell wall biosynthesis
MGGRRRDVVSAPEGPGEPAGEVDWVAYYGIPQRDPNQPHPVVRWPGPVTNAADGAKGRVRRLRHGRRLAYLDSHFPWRRSGFRYSEALALLEARPDTLFFSSYELTDPFPAPVHPLARFPRLAVSEGVTDVYAVFLLFLQGICGLGQSGADGRPHFMEGPDLWPLLGRRSIRAHGCIYPGGGFTLTDHGFESVAALTRRLTTTMSYIPEVLERVPGVVEIPSAFTDTAYYRHTDDRWERTDPLVCLIAADPAPRKGVDAALEAFRHLGPGFHLHVVGPHEHRRPELAPEMATFHGWLQPEGLRDLHRRVHLFVSPVRAEAPGAPGTHGGVTDGFPTQAASDAMSSGCLLVSSNPAQDHRVLTPGEHYVECPPDADGVRRALLSMAADPERMRRIAQQGAERVRRRLDVKLGARVKLDLMGLGPSAPTRT